MAADHVILFDCEWLAEEGSMKRLWCSPDDPDPVVVQIGAVKLSLKAPYPVLDTLRLHILPSNRSGEPVPLPDFFTGLTGISEAVLESEGLPLDQALLSFTDFAGEADLWSWGKDEIYLMAISCYLRGLPPPLPATRFFSAASLMTKAGMSKEDRERTRSSGLARYFQLDMPDLPAHDGLNDALGIALSLQHLLRSGRLKASDFRG
ncbi:3'-5' exonuclease family protein [Roseibium suaedae]|uniref:Exonuclease domain-containing protein n=1 Tax=Roseibium suaedae TaxID=735517 RepID=A0A1M7MYP4_9HYPH|nr:hypothetical protein [Roseibium suaedae]SHM96307.1 hypothetical protein SAMN05444272_3618 [Roseibium suaedae]